MAALYLGHRSLQALLAGVLLLVLPFSARSGGPLLVGGPNLGAPGEAIVWDAAFPAQYRVDGGPLSINPSGAVVVSNTAALTQIQSMFQVWQDVPTATISYSNVGPLLSAGVFTDGDVNTAEEFDAVVGSCESAIQSPIVLDANGSLFDELVGDPNVIGFAGTCALSIDSGRIVSGLAALNGRFIDGVESLDTFPPNLELTQAEFDSVFVHEFGHFSGLDHSQINVNCLDLCNADDQQGLPTMFPFLVSAQMGMLAPDDQAWISRLYPEQNNNPPNQARFTSAYGTISGTILFSDGITQVQGVNVIARQVDNPATPQNESRRVAVSVVSGYLFTGNRGQSVTGDNSGSLLGSRNPALIGTFEISVSPGSYTVEVESIYPAFVGGSGVGPLIFPIGSPGPREFWNIDESATDGLLVSTPITVSAGATVTAIDIILNNTAPRFDSFESAWRRQNTDLRRGALYAYARREILEELFRG